MNNGKLCFALVSDEPGGAEMSVSQIAKAARELGVCCRTGTLCSSSSAKFLSDLGFDVFTSELEFRKYLKNSAEESFRIITSHRNYEYTRQLLPNNKIVVVCRGALLDDVLVRVFDGNGLVKKSWRNLALDMRSSGLIIAPSKVVADGLIKYDIQCNHIIPNPVVTDVNFRPCRDQAFVHSWARAVEWKRVPILEKAFAVVWHEIKSELHIVEKSINLPSIHGHGFVRNPWLRANIGDIYGATSDIEAFGRDVYEAFTVGCLAIVCENTPAESLVRETGAGVIVSKSNNGCEWESALRSLLLMDLNERKIRGLKASALALSITSPTAVAMRYINCIANHL